MKGFIFISIILLVGCVSNESKCNRKMASILSYEACISDISCDMNRGDYYYYNEAVLNYKSFCKRESNIDEPNINKEINK